jgi:hypothetical protein
MGKHPGEQAIRHYILAAYHPLPPFKDPEMMVLLEDGLLKAGIEERGFKEGELDSN